ncbi:amino acid ABC transporter substrate-binding protein [Allofranklinella schreckenbergeri]|uniref:Amino acid ABC transporter substrate-binding protein n=1 Tax=Allofranklinella schreckenbergeri TaxID=1076744 RepID=A0A3M6QVT8_9BURK|nr:amino acid ABC transporter substrate-binding protein [Allofranklinella schreckenbergeri]RMX07130.1 amino acid ABC transporter substrate-binding protein [Allofranklinella schreckenbergeri]
MKKHLFALTLMAVATTAAFAQTNTLEKIKNSGEVSLGVRESSGLGYTLGNGKYVGFHTEMAENIIKDLEKEVGKPIKINYQPITSQNRIPLVTNGTIDFECGSTTNNLARQKDVDFAHTTYVEEVRMATKKDSGINSVADLKGKTVAVTTGTTSVQTLRKHRRAEGVNFKEVMGKDHADSFLLLETGRADVFVMDGSILAANIAKSQKPGDYHLVGEVLNVEPIACMLRKNDEAFKAAINKSIERQIKDGTLEKLWDKWFLQPTPPANTVINLQLSESTKKAWANPNNKPAEDYKVE